MRLPKLGLLKKGQKGFTLIELMIAMAISGIITGSVTMTIFQVVDSSSRTSNHMTAVRQVQSAGYWVSHDALMAQDLVLADESVDDPDGSRFPFTLTWSDWTNNEVYTVVYSIVGDELQRVEDKETETGTTSETVIVAEFIDPANTSCEYTGGTLTFTVTATVGDGSAAQIETRKYEVIPRPGS